MAGRAHLLEQLARQGKRGRRHHETHAFLDPLAVKFLRSAPEHGCSKRIDVIDPAFAVGRKQGSAECVQNALIARVLGQTKMQAVERALGLLRQPAVGVGKTGPSGAHRAYPQQPAHDRAQLFECMDVGCGNGQQGRTAERDPRCQRYLASVVHETGCGQYCQRGEKVRVGSAAIGEHRQSH